MSIDGKAGGRVSAALSAMIALTIPGTSLGWTQATTDEGLPLHRDDTCIHWVLGERGSDDVTDQEALLQASLDAFRTWTDVDCSYLAFNHAGPSSCTSAAYGTGHRQSNLVVWIEEDWPYEAGTGVPFAVTSVWYEKSTGKILDSDIEMNGVDFSWTATGEAGHADVWNTLAHEAGHTIGLDHSSVTGATMFPWSMVGEIEKRSLEADDVEGMCAMYPLASDPAACPEPPGTDALCEDDRGGCSCALAPIGGNSREATACILAIVVGGILLACARARAACRPHGLHALRRASPIQDRDRRPFRVPRERRTASSSGPDVSSASMSTLDVRAGDGSAAGAGGRWPAGS